MAAASPGSNNPSGHKERPGQRGGKETSSRSSLGSEVLPLVREITPYYDDCHSMHGIAWHCMRWFTSIRL
jgi:hypothetical protein